MGSGNISANDGIRVYYALNAQNINDPETYDIFFRLDLQENTSKFYDYLKYQSDSLVNEWKIKNPQAEGIPTWMGPKSRYINSNWSRVYGAEYVKDIPENKVTEYVFAVGIGKYWYSEKIPQIDWELKEDTLTIKGYLCQKAECFFRGRNYTAWFSTDIPASNGPWKFGGLPGLILKVYDEDNSYVFECTHIEYADFSITDTYPDYKKISKEKLRGIHKNVCENWIKAAGAVTLSLDDFLKGSVVVKPQSDNANKPYNPIELDF